MLYSAWQVQASPTPPPDPGPSQSHSPKSHMPWHLLLRGEQGSGGKGKQPLQVKGKNKNKVYNNNNKQGIVWLTGIQAVAGTGRQAWQFPEQGIKNLLQWSVPASSMPKRKKNESAKGGQAGR